MNKRAFLLFLLLLLLFLVNLGFLYNLKNLTYANYYLLLLVINLDLLVLLTISVVILRKVIKAFMEGRTKLRIKLLTTLTLFLFAPLLILNMTLVVVLIQSTKTYISSRTTDMSAKAQELYEEMSRLERKKLKNYEKIAKTVIDLGHWKELTRMEPFKRVKPIDTCSARLVERKDSYELCLKTPKGNFLVVVEKDIGAIKSIEEFGKLALDFRAFVKTRDIIAGIFVFFIVFLSLITLLSTIWLAILVAKRMSEPIEYLSKKVREIASGNLDTEVDIMRTGDEVEDLFVDFVSMKENLKSIYFQLQHERDLLNKLFDSLPVGVAYVNREGEPEKVNGTFRELYGEGKIEESKLKDLEKRYLRWQRIDTREGSIYILEDIQPIVLAERFKIWQEAVKRIAHEIKNPLTPIRLNLERIYRLSMKEEIDRDKVREMIPLMLREIDRITNLINQFRHLSGDKGLKLSRFNLRRLLEEMRSLYSGVNINLKGDREIEADYSALKEVFYNLINNSIEWGADRIDIEIKDSEIIFRDNGEGIEEGELENIFTPHFSKNPKGMGIGMAVVKKIIEEHGWRVEVFSEKGRGIEVRIRFS